jgi:hypothetical protein
MRIPRRRASPSLLLLLALAACGTERNAREADGREPASRRSPDFHAIGVALTGQAIRAAQGAVPAGPVTFSVANAGRVNYILVVEGPGVDARTQPIPPGGSGRIDVRLPPGTYRLRTIPEQASPTPAGGHATLTVT